MRLTVAGRQCAFAACAAALAAWPAAANTFPYRLLRRITLADSAPVSALAVAPSGRYLYAAQSRSVRVYTTAGARIAQRRLDGMVSALAAAADGEIIAALRHPTRLVILARKSLRVLRRRALSPAAPAALLYDPRAHMLFLQSRSRDTIERLDPATGRPLGKVRLAGALGQMAANGRGTLYVANSTHDALDVIDARRMRYRGAIPLSGCRAPAGLAIDPVGRRLFVACANGRALIVDADLGFTFAGVSIQRGARLRAAFAFHPLGRRGWKGGVFIAGGGALAAIQMQAFVRYRDGGRLALGRHCTALALDPRAGRLWLAIAAANGRPAALWMLGAPTAEAP